MDVTEAFGRAVKARRAEMQWTQDQVSEEGGFGRTFISSLERGEKAPTVATVWKVALALGCKPSDLWLKAEQLMANPPKAPPRKKSTAKKK